MAMAAIPSPWQVAADLLDPREDSSLWVPFPKQEIAADLASTADETLFGGAAGPGKTEWLMEYGIMQMEMFPGNRGIIFRRVFPSLNRSIIPRLKKKLKGRAKWNANEHTFTFDNDSVLECGSLQYADDVYNYQGTEYGWMGFEELTEFLEEQYEHMLTRLRAPADRVRPHVCSTTNPGGSGHRWVKRRFIKPDPKEDLEQDQEKPAPMRVWRPRIVPGRHDPEFPPGTRVFVPATHQDNPKLLERDPTYISRVRAVSKRGLRLALEHGDWDAIDSIEGALWSAEDLDRGRVNPLWFKQKVKTMRRVIAVDPSDGDSDTSDEFGISQCARGADGVGYVEGSWGWKNMSPKAMANGVLEIYRSTGADSIIVERNHGGKWLLEVFRMLDPYANVRDVWASDGKRTRAEPVAALFELDPMRRVELPYRARLVGFHPELEDELTGTEFKKNEPSPNQLDAMVWAMTDLMLRVAILEDETVKDERMRGRR